MQMHCWSWSFAFQLRDDEYVGKTDMSRQVVQNMPETWFNAYTWGYCRGSRGYKMQWPLWGLSFSRKKDSLHGCDLALFSRSDKGHGKGHMQCRIDSARDSCLDRGLSGREDRHESGCKFHKCHSLGTPTVTKALLMTSTAASWLAFQRAPINACLISWTPWTQDWRHAESISVTMFQGPCYKRCWHDCEGPWRKYPKQQV